MSSCEFPRCSNGAEFCFADEPGVPRFCAAHKDDTMIPIKSCEFPRCGEAPIYCFADEMTVARFCSKHKSDDMALIAGATAPATPLLTAVVVEEGPSPATLELAFKYFELKPEHDSLDTIKVDAATHQAKLDKLRHQIKKEDADIHKISKGIEKLETQLARQDKKLLNFGGKSLFGRGILMKDQKQVDKMSGEKKTNEKQKEVLESQKESDETNLSSMLAEQARLNDLVEIREALEARIKDLRDECLEAEGTTLMRRLQASKTDHDRMHKSLTFCRQDLMTAHKMFQKALQIQATAARSNAIAAGANIGQAIGGGGGRGIGNSPGERLMQIRRNQATKQSIELAQQACDKLNTAQHRLDNDLRVKFPDEMNGVGNVTIPDLWHGSFFRDFLVGQAAGNIGDAINQARAMKKIRKNMEELEKIIAVCVNQEQKLDVVKAKLVGSIAVLEKDVFAEEKRIIQGVIEVAKAAQATTPTVQAETFSA